MILMLHFAHLRHTLGPKCLKGVGGCGMLHFLWVHISIEILPHLVFKTEFPTYVHRFSASFPSIDVACCRWLWQPTPLTTATQRLAANPMRKPSECRDCPEISAFPSATARAAAQVMCQRVTAPLLSVLSEPPRVTSTAL